MSATARLPVAARIQVKDRVTISLSLVFLLSAAFYILTAATSVPLSLHGGQADPYNQLANAFLHLRLSVGHPPVALEDLPEPYNPAQNLPYQQAIHDFVLYHGKLFLTWGPAPVIVLLVPMHILGFEPTPSVTVSLFAIAGLGFALATLRVILRQVGETPLWMCVVAAATLALSSAIPFILRLPDVYEEEIAGGYCFAMAAIFLAITALANRRASLSWLALTSLCVGLAAGARPNLIFIGVLLVLVYTSLQIDQATARSAAGACDPHRSVRSAAARIQPGALRRRPGKRSQVSTGWH